MILGPGPTYQSMVASATEGPKMARVTRKLKETSRQLPFEFACSTSIFPAEELTALVEHGGRLEKLSAGDVAPAGAADEHFLKVERGEAEPKTLLERAWVRLKGRREYEREQNTAAPKPEAEDYGIAEWDEDRCWW
jgi:uncharacterized protein YifE (UPF0438 family)